MELSFFFTIPLKAISTSYFVYSLEMQWKILKATFIYCSSYIVYSYFYRSLSEIWHLIATVLTYSVINPTVQKDLCWEGPSYGFKLLYSIAESMTQEPAMRSHFLPLLLFISKCHQSTAQFHLAAQEGKTGGSIQTRSTHPVHFCGGALVLRKL